MTDPRNDNRLVRRARVVVHTTGRLGPQTPMSDNHWSIYLILAHNGGSVRLNMRANPGDPRGILELSSLAYTKPRSALNYWDYKMREGITVRQVGQLLVQYGRDRYHMSGGGSGCRFWVYVHPQPVNTSMQLYLLIFLAFADLLLSLTLQK